MPIDYRLDPFQDVLNPVTITGETHTIPSVSPFTIRLDEVPLKETPSSISLTIGGVRAEEVSSAPAAGQFWPDYSTGADGDDDWNTGMLLFNAADAGKTVVVTYKGTGVLISAETLKTHVFTSSGTITAPTWATHAIVSGCGGGGGGGPAGTGSGVTAGGTGGTTKFGDLLTLTGGVGGAVGDVGGAGGSGLSIPGASSSGGAGGGSPFGQGGAGRTTPGNGNAPSGYGGGAGGSRGGNSNGGGGGSGGSCINLPVAITPGATYTITIGAGGSRATGATYHGTAGAPGILIVRWARI